MQFDVFLTHIGLVLFQNNMPWEFRLWYRCKLFNDVLQGLQASHPQLVTVVCCRHEGHADEVRQMEHQQISWMGGGKKTCTYTVRKRRASNYNNNRDLSRCVMQPDNNMSNIFHLCLIFALVILRGRRNY